jgi:Membrane carboxypeptidase (penicillin-binding protein)
VKPRENDPIVASGLLLDIMKQVVNIGTGVYARQKVPVAGKTGTSDRNAWFIGGDSHIILSVVVDGENITGGTRAAPLWAKIMSSYPYRGVFSGMEDTDIG